MNRIGIILGFISLLSISLHPQKTISIEDYARDYVDGKKSLQNDGVTYVKDINNIRDKYVGNWFGLCDGKLITFKIRKFTEINDVLPPEIKLDVLSIRHKITKTGVGEVIDDTMNLDDNDPLVITGSYLDTKYGNYVLDFITKDRTCGRDGTLYIKTDSKNTDTVLKCTLILDSKFVDNTVCSESDNYKYLPKHFVLLKSNNSN